MYGGYHFGSHAFNTLFLETAVDGGVVFEPLRVAADGFGAMRGRQVFEVDKRFPRALDSERVAVHFNKAVHKINSRTIVAHPQNVILVPQPQVARAVVLNQFADALALLVGFGVWCGLF